MRLEHLTISFVVEFPNAEGFWAHKQSSSSNFQGFQTKSRGCSGRIGRGRSSFGGRNYFSLGANSKLLCQICGKFGHSAIKCYIGSISIVIINLSLQKAQSILVMLLVISQFQSSQAYIASPKDVDDASWFLDSGATHHVTTHGDSLTSKTEYSGSGKLMLGDGTELPISHIGKIDLADCGTFSKPLAL